MSETTSPIPVDQFSQMLRRLEDDPGAVSSTSTVRLSDFYGNTEAWVIQTFRRDGGDTVFIDRSAANGHMRFVLPIEVTRALTRHRDQLSSASRRKSGHKLIALRRERGDVLGNPAALAKARKARRKAAK